MNNINEKNSLLGSKREKNDSNTNNDDSFSSTDSINENKNSKKEKDNFKDLFCGKLEFGNPKNAVNKSQIIKKDKIKKNTQKKNNIISLLPPPKVKLTDKSNKISFSQITSCKMKSLINPDLIQINEKKEIEHNRKITTQREINEIELINQKDLVDKDWERKYIDKINKAESLGIKEEEDSNPMANEHNIKNIINKYNSEQSKALSSMEVKSKYGKISTKAKYGW